MKNVMVNDLVAKKVIVSGVNVSLEDFIKNGGKVVTIPGTNPNHPYDFIYGNEKGVVALKDVKVDGEWRVRVILWENIVNGDTSSGNYDALIAQGFEAKPYNHHVSKRLDSKEESCSYVIKAVEFLNK